MCVFCFLVVQKNTKGSAIGPLLLPADNYTNHSCIDQDHRRVRLGMVTGGGKTLKCGLKGVVKAQGFLS